ncbi:alcohol dehydrogenase catalytic domain-containing protein [Crossiella sp. CA-258035]|uniref:zinc-dependent alcohol dehydrogenase n=1 Tax=Crossiella sp. CA-258035 TaxID=2981138 RepID=UPI0024BD11EA|nr:alcohol dehydrogenase catalytic domain-containing protein [Crossiella sp. CA-258035]WHT20557.1 alcohol dehydrogenase catalytic domain-containing protein [Crossiella sp. CA-258035]
MHVLQFRGPGELTLEQRAAPPAPGPGQVTFRPTLAGVCGTDRAIYLGRYHCEPPRVLGHEAVGVVTEVGEGVTRLRPGDRVVLDPTQSCGRCDRCLRAESSHCANKSALEIGVGRDGAFAQLLTVEEQALYPLPADVPDRRGVLIEPLACVLTGLRAAAVGPDDRVVVLGGGPMGVLSALLAVRWAARVSLVEPDPYRRELAEAVTGLTPLAELDESASPPPTVVVDTTGSLLEPSLRTVQDGGRVLLLGCDTAATATVRPFDLTGRCVSLIGSCDYHAQVFPAAIELIRGLPCEQLVTDVFPLTESSAAFELLALGPGSGYGAGKLAFAP